jgi:hypothetical protein
MSEKIPQEEIKSWVTQVGEAEGVHDRRVELMEYRATLANMLETIDEDLSSAFPTIADVTMRPKVVRALEVVDLLVATPLGDTETWNGLSEELGALDVDMMRGMRSKFIQDTSVRIGAIFNDDRVASEDHTTIIPDGWDKAPKH